ncbi:hypothetical protein CsSME_00005595 [Camellia sinensis var. sinensis]
MLLKHHHPHSRTSLQPPCTSHRNDDLPVHGVSEIIVAASQLAIKVIVLDLMENCPASSLSHYHMVGSYDDSAMVQEFAKRLEILFEFCVEC